MEEVPVLTALNESGLMTRLLTEKKFFFGFTYHRLCLALFPTGDTEESITRHLRWTWIIHTVQVTGASFDSRTRLHGGEAAGRVQSRRLVATESASGPTARSFHSVCGQYHCHPLVLHSGFASNELWEEASGGKNQAGQLTLGILFMNGLVFSL